MLLSAYELEQALSRKFTVSLESEQEIEIEAEEVIINSPVTVDSDIEELAEDVDSVNEASDNIESVDEASATLESLIVTMESRLLLGGFDKTNAQLANISLESITTRFGLDNQILSFGMEAVEDDAEAETKNTIGKAKQMLGALKSNSSALINKMYISAASALGNNAALSSKLIAKATSLKSNINSDNSGGNELKLPRGVVRKLTLDGKTVLSPEAYLKELQRVTNKYNTVVKAYADNDILAGFITDAVAGMADKPGEPKSKKAIINAVKTLSEDITKVNKSKDGVEQTSSEPYLGGVLITKTRPTTKSVEDMLSQAVTKDKVSQEGVGSFAAGSAKLILGSALFVIAGHTVLVGSLGTVAAVTALVKAPAITAAIAAPLGIDVAMTMLGMFGMVQSDKLIARGVDQITDEVVKAYKISKSKLSRNAEETAELCSEFEVNGSGISMEADDTTSTTATSLSNSQIAKVSELVINTSTTTKTINAQLSKRKAIMKSVDQLTKAIAKGGDGANNQLVSASNTFVKQFIKQTVKFEMDLTTYSVQTMKAALAYAEASNGATAPAAPETETEKKD